MNINSDAMAFSVSLNMIGLISEVNFKKSTITLEVESGECLEVEMEDVKILDVIGVLGGECAYNHDVLMSADGKLYEIELQEDNKNVKLHLLNEGLQRIKAGVVFLAKDIHLFSKELEVVGNIHELMKDVLEAERVEMEMDEENKSFNIKTVRELKDGNTTYYYACNNLENEEIDLIKVIYVGHYLLEEEKYVRNTVSHDEFEALLENGKLKEVNPIEIMHFITGATYNDMKDSSSEYSLNEELTESDETADATEVETESDTEYSDEEACDCDDCRMDARGLDFCSDCGDTFDDCECEW